MKIGMLYLLILTGCWSDSPPPVHEYALTWICQSPGGCERMEAVARIDRMEEEGTDCHFTSTQDESFSASATQVIADFLPPRCEWLYFLTLFEHELERSRFCFVPGGFELELSIPNEDPATSSMWLVEGRDVDL